MPAENGYVPTPAPVADYAAATAFGASRPSEIDNGRMLFPGLGTGNLYDAVRRYCTEGENWYVPRFDYEPPDCIGVDNDPARIEEFDDQHADTPIDVVESDFLLDPPDGKFDWILGNPPYVRYNRLPKDKRSRYREKFTLATDQFPLYVPFFEQALRLLKPGGWLTFILPIGALTTGVAEPLRDTFRFYFTGPIMYFPEQTFNRQVETFLVGLKKEETEGHHLWLESLYEYELRPILKRLDVDDIDDAVSSYYTSHKLTERMVTSRDARERESRQTSRQAKEAGGSAKSSGRQVALGEY